MAKPIDFSLNLAFGVPTVAGCIVHGSNYCQQEWPLLESCLVKMLQCAHKRPQQAVIAEAVGKHGSHFGFPAVTFEWLGRWSPWPVSCSLWPVLDNSSNIE